MTAPGLTVHAHATPALRPFTAIEELDHYLDDADEPNLIHLELHVPGHLDADALRAAIGRALTDMPSALRRRAVAARWDRRLRWEAAAVPRTAPDTDPCSDLLVVGWRRPDQLTTLRETLFASPLPLHDAALRVALAVGRHHDVVLVQTHHAAFDGISSLALLASVASAYRDRAGVRTDIDAPLHRPPADGALPNRSRTASPPSQPAARRGVRTTRGQLPGVVTRIASQGGHRDQPGYGFVLASTRVPWPPHQGPAPHPTVNDLLVAALILTVERWNAAHGMRSRQIRITVPVNDREPRQRWEGQGNRSRLVKVTTYPGQRGEPAGLLNRVAEQTRAGKLCRRSRTDMASRLLAGAWAPVGVKERTVRLARRVAGPVIADTSLVTNLGAIPDPPSFGGTTDEPLWFSTPAPMPRGLSVGAVTVTGRLRICVRYRCALLDRQAAAGFTAAYCDALTELSVPDHIRPP